MVRPLVLFEGGPGHKTAHGVGHENHVPAGERPAAIGRFRLVVEVDDFFNGGKQIGCGFPVGLEPVVADGKDRKAVLANLPGGGEGNPAIAQTAFLQLPEVAFKARARDKALEVVGKLGGGKVLDRLAVGVLVTRIDPWLQGLQETQNAIVDSRVDRGPPAEGLRSGLEIIRSDALRSSFQEALAVHFRGLMVQQDLPEPGGEALP